jgi:predicted Rossmann fold nucleotide-binding protein DprA/Smf involved in DNA uptake
MGAVPATAAADVLAALGLELPEPPPLPSLTAGAAQALAAIHRGATTADEVVRTTKLDVAVVAAALVELELAGVIREAAGVYRR